MEYHKPFFKVHKLNQRGFEKAQVMQQKFEDLANFLENELKLPVGREFSLCMTKLEEACFFAKKSMAMNPENQEGDPSGNVTAM